ncbi:MAG: DNA-processing protein DprA [Candidatus Buchananbacteria bacterium]
MSSTDLPFWLAFNQFTKLGPVRFKKLYSYFPNLQTAWAASLSELITCGLEPDLAQEIISRRPQINPEAELTKLHTEKVQAVTILEEAYPPLLKEIYSPPPILYYRGTLDNNRDRFALGVVGTRKVSPYGQQLIDTLIIPLVQAGLTIVSGLALGIDTLAHQATLQNQGRTLAVLGSGLAWSSLYPTQNRSLAEKIIAAGSLMVSEFPLSMPPLVHNFPLRNRIISGLSLGTLIIEAPAESGALITAKYALEQNREVFAVPGNIYHPNSAGTNNLIKQGAIVVTTAQDILGALDLKTVSSYITAHAIVPESPAEESLLKHLNREPIHIDSLAKLTKLNISTVAATLAVMEIKGKIKNLGGQNYVCAR